MKNKFYSRICLFLICLVIAGVAISAVRWFGRQVKDVMNKAMCCGLTPSPRESFSVVHASDRLSPEVSSSMGSFAAELEPAESTIKRYTYVDEPRSIGPGKFSRFSIVDLVPESACDSGQSLREADRKRIVYSFSESSSGAELSPIGQFQSQLGHEVRLADWSATAPDSLRSNAGGVAFRTHSLTNGSVLVERTLFDLSPESIRLEPSNFELEPYSTDQVVVRLNPSLGHHLLVERRGDWMFPKIAVVGTRVTANHQSWKLTREGWVPDGWNTPNFGLRPRIRPESRLSQHPDELISAEHSLVERFTETGRIVGRCGNADFSSRPIFIPRRSSAPEMSQAFRDLAR